MMFVDVSVIFSRRYYTETKSPSQKDEMDAKANEYVGKTVSTIRDIWRDADL